MRRGAVTSLSLFRSPRSKANNIVRLLSRQIQKGQSVEVRPFFLPYVPGDGLVRKEPLLEGTTKSVVVDPSARETFTPRELAATYEEFKEHGAQYQDAETGLSASAYRFGERVLVLYEESETGLVVLIHPTA